MGLRLGLGLGLGLSLRLGLGLCLRLSLRCLSLHDHGGVQARVGGSGWVAHSNLQARVVRVGHDLSLIHI